MQSFYEVVSNEKYVDFDNMSDKLYEQVMTEIGSIIDSQVSVLSKDGETTVMLPANEAMVRFCQYMYAYSAGRYDDSYLYMKKVFETEPSYLWLYAYELGLVELQKGNYEDAEFYADAMLNVNVEASDGYSLKSTIARVKGDTDAALAFAEKGLSYDSSNIELVRAKAIAYAASGDFENAKKMVDEAMSVTSYGMLHMTAAVIENELGNKDAVESYLNELEQNDLELSEKLQSYFDGEITAVQVFTEGTGDVE
jgi:tetratricopeptide (TPR) repeat protein